MPKHSIATQNSKKTNKSGLLATSALSRPGELKELPLQALKPYPNNPRIHSEKQIAALCASICQFGEVAPIIVDEENTILAGHGRYEALKRLNRSTVRVMQISGLKAKQKKAYVLADNKIAEGSSWHEELLALQMVELSANDGGLDGFDIESTGFSTAEIDDLLLLPSTVVADKADLMPEDMAAPQVSRLGDVWLFDGRHSLICWSATEEKTYKRLLNGQLAQMVITDPPYNVSIKKHALTKNKQQHDEFLMASGEMSEAEFTGFLAQSLGFAAANSLDGSIHFVFMDHGHMSELLTAGMKAYHGKPKQVCVWNKTNAGMGSFYRSKHEHIFVYKNGSASHINNFNLGEKGRYRTNVWDYPGVNCSGSGKNDLDMHPTVKPVAMIADAIRDCSKRDGLILDPFGGSGTTLIAAHKIHRRAALIELDPKYVDVTVSRFRRLYDLPVIHAETGKSYDQIAAERNEQN